MPGVAVAYLAAEAEAQGQEAEEVLAPSDHAGEAPAQSSHSDPQGGCLGSGSGREDPMLPARSWEGAGGGMRGEARALPRGVPDPQRRRRTSSPRVLAPLAGGARPKPRGATPKCRRLPEVPASPASALRDCLLRGSLSPALGVAASGRPAPQAGCGRGRAQAPRNVGGSRAAQERRVRRARPVHLRPGRRGGRSIVLQLQ